MAGETSVTIIWAPNKVDSVSKVKVNKIKIRKKDHEIEIDKVKIQKKGREVEDC